MKKVIITGASGLLGRSLVKAFKEASWEVCGLAFSRASGDLIKADLNNSEEISHVVKKFQPDIIVHSAAQRFPDKVENDYDGSYKLNVTAAKNLAQIAAQNGIGFILISTDYVFDGNNPPYKESDKPSPLNKYGQTKADAEAAVTNVKPDSCILRIPVLYGDEEYVGESAVSSLLKILKDNSKQHKVSDYEIRYPSHTDDIAALAVHLSNKRLQDNTVSGVYHWCGSEPLTKYQMIKIIAEAFGLPSDHIVGDKNPSAGAPRPYNSQLSRGRVEAMDFNRHTAFKDGVRSFQKFL